MLSADYVVGLADGEGSFNARVNPSNRRRAKVEARFSLKLRASDKQILHQLQAFFGCGSVYIQTEKRPRHSLCYLYEIQRRADLWEIVIPFFERNPPHLQSKQKDFMLFKRIVGLVKEQADKTENGMDEIATLIKEMH